MNRYTMRIIAMEAMTPWLGLLASLIVLMALVHPVISQSDDPIPAPPSASAAVADHPGIHPSPQHIPIHAAASGIHPTGTADAHPARQPQQSATGAGQHSGRRRLFPAGDGSPRGGQQRMGQTGMGLRRRKFRQESNKEEYEAKNKHNVASEGTRTIDDVLASEESLQRFLSIADSLGMRNIFAETEDITVLAVVNDVELAGWEAEIASDPDPSKHIDRMKRHILTESTPFYAMSNVQPVPTMSEEILVISHRDGGRIVVFDDDTYELAQIARTDLEGSNGFVHVVDRVLVRHADSLRP